MIYKVKTRIPVDAPQLARQLPRGVKPYREVEWTIETKRKLSRDELRRLRRTASKAVKSVGGEVVSVKPPA